MPILLFVLGCEAAPPADDAPAAASAAPSSHASIAASVAAAPVSAAPEASTSVAPDASARRKKKRRRKRKAACVLPEASPPTRKSPTGATAPVSDWMGPQGCQVPKGFRPWSWSMLRRVRGLPEKTVIITVDGGHNLPITHQGLDVLRDYDVRATYFITTSVLQQVAGGRALVQRIATEGHELANHSVTHPKLTELPDDEVRTEIGGVDEWIAEVVGYSPRPFFRPPYLDHDERTDRITRDLCYRPVWFTTYTRDDEQGVKWQDIAKAVLCDDEREHERKIKRGSIFMFHASQIETVKAWPVIITGLRNRGFGFMTLSEAIQAREPKKDRKRRKRRR